MEAEIEMFRDAYPECSFSDEQLKKLFEQFDGEYHLVTEHFEKTFMKNQIESSDSNFDFNDYSKKNKMNAFEFLSHNHGLLKKAEKFLKEKSKILQMKTSDFIKENQNLDEAEFRNKLKQINEEKGRKGVPFDPLTLGRKGPEESLVINHFKRNKRKIEDCLREANERLKIVNKFEFDLSKESWVKEFFSNTVANSFFDEHRNLNPNSGSLPQREPQNLEYMFLKLGSFVDEETSFDKFYQSVPEGTLLEVYLEDNSRYVDSLDKPPKPRFKAKMASASNLPGRIYLRFNRKKLITLSNKYCRELYLLLRKNFIKMAVWVVESERSVL